MPAALENPILIGADTSSLLTAEYRIPLVGPLQLNGFFDIGTSWILRENNLSFLGRDTSVEVLENTNGVWRMSTGAEIQFLLPVINQPFRLIFAYNPLALDTDIVLDGVRLPLRESRSGVKFTVGYGF